MKTLKLLSKEKGEGFPILLVPGGLTGWNSWEPFIELFTAQQRRVISVQLINVEYGIEGRELPDDYSVNTESEALTATIDSLYDIDTMDVVGWSFGALVSLNFALSHPERVRTLTLIEPPAIWVLRALGEVDEQTQKTIDVMKSLSGEITDDMLAAFLGEVGFVREGQSPRSLPQWQNWLPFKLSLRNSPAVVSHEDKIERIKGFFPPVLLVKGSNSADFLHKITDGLHANFPNSWIIELPEGHAPHIVTRDKFLSELKSFQKNLARLKPNYVL